MSAASPGLLGAFGLAAAGVMLACAAYLACRSPALRALFGKRAWQYEQAARLLLWRATGRHLLTLQMGLCGSLGGLLVARPHWVWGCGLAIGLVAPQLWLDHCQRRRVVRIESQLDGWLLMLANALKASASLLDGLRISAALVPMPLRGEIELALREYRLGTPLDRALSQMERRLDSRLVSAAVRLIVVSRNAGGDLSGTLETSAANLREMARLEGVMRTKTAEGRVQAALIALLPFPMLWAIHGMDPQFLAPLVDTTRGHAVLLAAAGIWLCAVLLARRIVQADL